MDIEMDSSKEIDNFIQSYINVGHGADYIHQALRRVYGLTEEEVSQLLIFYFH